MKETTFQSNNGLSEKKDYTKLAILLAVIAVLVAALIVLFINYKGLLNSSNNTQGSIVIQNGNELVDDDFPDLSNRYVHYSGIMDSTISEESVVNLVNLEENGDILLKFEVYENENLIYSSDYVKSGEYITWEAGKDLPKGTHKVSIKQSPIIMYKDSPIDLTSATNEVVFEVL